MTIRMAYLLVVAALTACSSAPPVPQDHFYRLGGPATAQTAAAVEGQIAVAALEADGIYRDRAILFVDEAQPLEIQRYDYHLWSTHPSILLQEQLIGFLRANSTAAQVSRYDPAQPTDWIVRGRILRFERVVGTSASRAEVALELELFRHGQNAPAMSKTYRTSVDTGRSMHEVAAGFDQAVDKIFAQLVQDMVGAAQTTRRPALAN